MDAVALNPREVAATLGLTTQDLAKVLFEKAGEVMADARRIAVNDPWHAPEDGSDRIQELWLRFERVENLMRSGFACEAAWMEDHPEEYSDGS
jgi:hypothetical protein